MFAPHFSLPSLETITKDFVLRDAALLQMVFFLISQFMFSSAMRLDSEVS